ncbi:MAG TPA: MFS transporter [Candidatus Limnocylindrales bacterium]|nr:MFS transporter [Candidatus Limnocylindrales bacterium]
MTRDARLLFAARGLRMFAYGSLAVILVLYLVASGLDGASIGVLLSLTLTGDTLISLWLTTHADRFGRRRTLILGALLMAAAGAAFATSSVFVVLLVAATLGVISPSGNEVGPFLAIEQASLSHVIEDRRRTGVFAWYNLIGSVATAFGALATGFVVGWLRGSGVAELAADRTVLLGYGIIGLLLIPVFLAVSSAVEVPPIDTSIARRLGLHRSKGIVARLALLMSLDSFAGGFVMQSLLAFWFYTRFGVPEPVLGAIFFGANILAAVSALAAARIARRIGLINTMVLTHLPSNVLLMLVPLMPTLPLAILVLLARFSISQMDVPTRQSYTMAVVDPDERSAAAGVTGIARTAGTAVSPLIAGPLLAVPGLAAVPFLLAGGLKIVYDLLLWRAFRSTPAPEDPKATAPTETSP